MLQTPNYKFMQLEQAEQFQYDIVNQNFSALDALLKSSFDNISTELSKKMPKTGGTFSGPVAYDWSNGGGFTFKLADSKSATMGIEANGNFIFSGNITGTNLIATEHVYEGGKMISSLYAAASHTHAYLPTSGGTVSGNLTVTGTITQAGTTLANTYAPKSHTHTYLPLAGGTVTGATTFSSTVTINGNTTCNGELYIASGKWIRCQGTTGLYFQTYGGGWYMTDATWIRAYNNKSIYCTGAITATGNITGAKVYNAVWNDYAEYFPRGEETEPGDIIMVDPHSLKEVYVRACSDSEKCIPVGVHSDTYGHLIGGDKTPNENVDFEKFNIKKYIPIGLAGRVRVKYYGPASVGTRVVPSEIPGVGRAYDKECDSPDMVVGILVEADDKMHEVRRLNMKIK